MLDAEEDNVTTWFDCMRSFVDADTIYGQQLDYYLYLPERWSQWKLMCQSRAVNIHFVCVQETPQNCCTAACRSHKYGCLGSPPPQQGDLQQLQGENTHQNHDFN